MMVFQAVAAPFDLGFSHASASDPSLFVKTTKPSFLAPFVYVDDVMEQIM